MICYPKLIDYYTVKWNIFTSDFICKTLTFALEENFAFTMYVAIASYIPTNLYIYTQYRYLWMCHTFMRLEASHEISKNLHLMEVRMLFYGN